MCGIAGCLKMKGEIDHAKFDKMIDIIEHRGPDDRGAFYENTLALGHRRLSIIDLSSDGHQPFLYENRYVLVFNGEIYNYLELKERLKQEGCQFKTKTDTEVLVAAYSFWREECVEYFNGMWAFAIYDREEQKIFCSRDRFGVKPFYYTTQEGMFLFASEIKQFFEMLQHKPTANKDALLQYIIMGNMDYSNETMFQDIFQLSAGHNLIYDIKEQNYKIEKYYDICRVIEKEEPYEDACRKFRQAFYESVNFRLRADVPIGYCLSGGLDSSAIVCMADKIVEKQGDTLEQHTISSCFEDKRYDEQEYIDEVVGKTSVFSHKIFPQETNLFADLDNMIWHMDEPFGSTSVYAQWNVFKEAKKNRLKVMLDGQGADEQLAGYSGFYKVKFADYLGKKQLKKFIREWRVYKENRAVTERYIPSKEIILSAVASSFMPDRYKYILKNFYFCLPWNKIPFSNKQLSRVLKDEPLYPMRDARHFIATSMKNGMATLLHYEDRDSMAHSIESRVPFLDINLVETIYAMPFDYKLKNGVTKAVMRDGLKGILPDKIRNRYSKLGFVTPEDQWISNNFEKYRVELKESVKILSDILLEPNKIMKWFDDNESKMKREDFTAWRIICAGHWVKLFQVSLK